MKRMISVTTALKKFVWRNSITLAEWQEVIDTIDQAIRDGTLVYVTETQKEPEPMDGQMELEEWIK